MRAPVNIPGPPYGRAKKLDEAKQRFKAAWLTFNDKHGPEMLAKVFVEIGTPIPFGM